MRTWCILWCTVATLGAFQTVQSPRSPYERRWSAEAAIRGRFLSPDGAPVAGVLVQAQDVSAVSDATGRFILTQLPKSTTGLLFEPPEPWMRGEVAAEVVTGATTDVGDVTLQSGATIHVEVIATPNARLAFDPRQLQLSLSSLPAFYPGLRATFSGVRPGDHTLYVSAGEGPLVIRELLYTATIQVRPGVSNQHFRIRLLGPAFPRRSNIQNVEVTTFEGPELTPAPERFVNLRVLAPDGQPLSGALSQWQEKQI